MFVVNVSSSNNYNRFSVARTYQLETHWRSHATISQILQQSHKQLTLKVLFTITFLQFSQQLSFLQCPFQKTSHRVPLQSINLNINNERKMAPFCSLGQPITARDFSHHARSWSQPYNKSAYRHVCFPFDQKFQAYVQTGQALNKAPGNVSKMRTIPHGANSPLTFLRIFSYIPCDIVLFEKNVQKMVFHSPQSGALYQEPATPILSQCNGIFTDQSIFRYFPREIGQFQST